jgi:membrane protein
VTGLLSGFILSIFLMANGLNGILGGFETSRHVLIKRGFIHIVALECPYYCHFYL